MWCHGDGTQFAAVINYKRLLFIIFFIFQQIKVVLFHTLYGKEDGAHERGVAIALGPRAEKMLERYECVNERIVCCRLRGKYSNLTVVQVYAPPEDKSD